MYIYIVCVRARARDCGCGCVFWTPAGSVARCQPASSTRHIETHEGRHHLRVCAVAKEGVLRRQGWATWLASISCRGRAVGVRFALVPPRGVKLAHLVQLLGTDVPDRASHNCGTQVVHARLLNGAKVCLERHAEILAHGLDLAFDPLVGDRLGPARAGGD